MKFIGKQNIVYIYHNYRLYDTIQTVLEELNVNRNDYLYLKINYIREEVAQEITKMHVQTNLIGNIINNNANNGNDQFKVFTESIQTINQNEYNGYINQKIELVEKIVDEEEIMRNKILFNKHFFNK